MVLYNVTVKVDHSIASEWLIWLKKEHIPDIIATGCFTHASVYHLFEADDEEGVTYAVQYYTGNISSYKRYISEYADEMRNKASHKWGNKFIAFRTVMQVVD